MSDKKNGFHAAVGNFICEGCNHSYQCHPKANPKKCANCLRWKEQGFDVGPDGMEWDKVQGIWIKSDNVPH